MLYFCTCLFGGFFKFQFGSGVSGMWILSVWMQCVLRIHLTFSIVSKCMFLSRFHNFLMASPPSEIWVFITSEVAFESSF